MVTPPTHIYQRFRERAAKEACVEEASSVLTLCTADRAWQMQTARGHRSSTSGLGINPTMYKPTQGLDDQSDKGVLRSEDARAPVLPSNRRTGVFPGNGDLRDPDNALPAVKLGRALRARDQQISLVAEAANIGFWSRDFAREDFWACDKWRALFGFTISETLNIDKFLQRLHPDDRESTLQALESAYQGDGIYQTEHRVLLPDGEVRWFHCQGRLELNGDDQPLRLEGVSLDITRRKLAELEAQAHRNEAAHLLRVASVGELSSALAHELRQPLTAILSNVQAAQLLLARENFDLQQLRDILADIVADDVRAGQVIDRLHVFLKRREFHPEPLDANQLIRDVLQLMNHELVGRSVRVVTELTAGVLSIRGDRVQLQQVLLNLILNAIDSMSQPMTNDRTLTLRSCRMAGNLIRISVADTGHGIPRGDEERIFESYYTTKSAGLGLGLSLSRSILIAHGGQLQAENHGSVGATFHCAVPEWRDGCANGAAAHPSECR
jgi:two-component system, LuxR family, sensor kinase FixL